MNTSALLDTLNRMTVEQLDEFADWLSGETPVGSQCGLRKWWGEGFARRSRSLCNEAIQGDDDAKPGLLLSAIRNAIDAAFDAAGGEGGSAHACIIRRKLSEIAAEVQS